MEQIQELYNEWRENIKEKTESELRINFSDLESRMEFLTYAKLNRKPTEDEMNTWEMKYLEITIGKEKIQEFNNQRWYAQCLYEGISRNIKFHIYHEIGDYTKELTYVVQRYCDECVVSGHFLREELEQYKKVVKEREESFIDGIELAFDMSEDVSKEDMEKYSEYIEKRTELEKVEKAEEPKKSEITKHPRMMGNAR